jgi:cobalt/nickel transport system ATP-binding protein
VIRLSGLTFGYNSRPILNGLDLSVGPGDRIGILGSNGSGKTTLCHLILGLLKPHSGTVTIFGRERVSDADFATVRGRIGLLFQDPDDQLFCPTVLDDTAFGPLNMGKTPAEATAIATATLAKLGLSGFEGRFTHQLSGGEKRLVSLAAVLAMEPECLLLDEPTAGLDESVTARLIEILRQSDYSYVLISHDREFMKETVNKVFRFQDGRLTDALL